MSRPSLGTNSTRILAVLIGFLLVASFARGTDITPEQLNTALESAGIKRIVKLQTFESRRGQYLLIYGGDVAGKLKLLILQDTTLNSGGPGVKSEWQSGVLPDEFSVTSGGMPYIEMMNNGDTAMLFSGCMPHNCGGKAGAMVYSVDRHELFKATYDSSTSPQRKYSANALVEKNSLYKQALDGMLPEHAVKTNSK